MLDPNLERQAPHLQDSQIGQEHPQMENKKTHASKHGS